MIKLLIASFLCNSIYIILWRFLIEIKCRQKIIWLKRLWLWTRLIGFLPFIEIWRLIKYNTKSWPGILFNRTKLYWPIVLLIRSIRLWRQDDIIVDHCRLRYGRCVKLNQQASQFLKVSNSQWNVKSHSLNIVRCHLQKFTIIEETRSQTIINLSQIEWIKINELVCQLYPSRCILRIGIRQFWHLQYKRYRSLL